MLDAAALQAWLDLTVRTVTTGPLRIMSLGCNEVLPGHIVVDRTTSPSPRTIGDMLLLATGRRARGGEWERWEDRLVAAFGQEGLNCVNRAAPLDQSETWLLEGTS